MDNKRDYKDEEKTGSRRILQDEGKFGYFCFAPSWLQWLNNPWWFLVGIFGLMFGQSLAVLGFLSIVMPQIEKRFNFSSFDVGMIAAANDVPAVIFGLIISHYGNFGNKIKWIGLGGIVTGIGFIIFSLPHFIIDSYDPPHVSYPDLLCTPPAPTAPPSANATTKATACDKGLLVDWYYLALLLIGQFIAGAGTVPLYTFPPKCFQESVNQKFIPLFLAIWQGSAFLGPMIAFGVSEPILELYVDIDQPEGFNMTPKDPRWIGNWWVGFLAAAGISILSALFLLGFPRVVAGGKYRPEKELQAVDNMSAKEKLGELWSALKEVLTNWTFVFNCLGVNATLMYAEGLAPFIAKILILQYGVEPEKVGNALTIAAAPPLLIGILASSLILSMFKLEESGKKSAFCCFILQIFTAAGALAFLIPGCEELDLAGHQGIPYGIRTGFGKTSNFTEFPAVAGMRLGSTCNQNCGCHLGIALPVCGSDNITYLSPCYAGCANFASLTTFANCSCIASENAFGGGARIGYCDQNCKNWLGFLVAVSVVTLAFFSQLGPTKVVLMRCVRPERLAFAFGLQFMSMKIIAHIPGPILFGHVVDLHCAIWQTVCDETGYCWIYDLQDKKDTITMICGILAAIGVLFFMLSWLVYKEADHSSSMEGKTGKDGKHIDNPGYQRDGLAFPIDDTKL